MESTLLPASPAEPAAPYLGGKRFLARRIIERLGATPHRTYLEPFVGMGGIFLRCPFRAKSEVINDISANVANLFRILQRHYVAFMDCLRWQITSRSEFERLKAARPETLTDLERAARFLYLQRTAFGGKVQGQNFGVDPRTPGRFDVTKLGPVLEALHERLAGVVIEHLPYADVIRRYDTPETLVYLDPPYWGCETDYGEGVFGREDFERLAELLATMQGQFLLSINDRPEVRRIFGAFDLQAVEVTYTVTRSATKPRAKELLITRP